MTPWWYGDADTPAGLEAVDFATGMVGSMSNRTGSRGVPYRPNLSENKVLIYVTGRIVFT